MAAARRIPERARRWAPRLLVLLVWFALVELAARGLAAPYIARRFYCCTAHPTLCEIGQAYREHGEFPEFRSQPVRFFEHDPVLGHRLRAGLTPRDYKGGVLSTNALGARGPAQHPYARVAGRTRYVAVGDSYTMGQEVDDGETWAAQLEARDPSREVINLGTSAYGVDQALLMLRREGMRYRPDTVLFGYFRDDLLRDMDRFTCSAKPRFVPRGDGLALEGVPVPSVESLRDRVRRASVAWLLARHFADLALRPAPTPDETQALGLRLVDEMARTAREGGARLVVVHMPDVFAFDHPDGWRDPFLVAACARPGVACIDPLPAMRAEAARAGAHARASLFRVNHYNPLGNRVVADAIDAWLRAHPRAP